MLRAHSMWREQPHYRRPPIYIVGSPVEAGGALALTGGSALTIGGPVTAPTISLTGGLGGITLTGNAKMGQNGGAIDITSTGPVFQNSHQHHHRQFGDQQWRRERQCQPARNQQRDKRFPRFLRDRWQSGPRQWRRSDPVWHPEANNLFFEVAKAGGTLTLGRRPVSENITPQPAEPAELNAVATGGRISLVADNYNVLLPTGPTPSSITTNAGTVELAPFSAIPTSLSVRRSWCRSSKPEAGRWKSAASPMFRLAQSRLRPDQT